MPDLVHSIAAHNRTMLQWWRKSEYKCARREFIRRNPVCIRCGRPAVTPGHCHEDYRDFETYVLAVKTGKTEPLCAACNLCEKRGMVPCPGCVKKLEISNEPIKIHYISQYTELCKFCSPPKKKRARVPKHRCDWNQGNQRCKSPLRYSHICDRSSVRADGCDCYLARVQV